MKLLRRKPSTDTPSNGANADEVRAAHACASWLMAYPDDALIDRLETIGQLATGLDPRFAEPLGRSVAALAAADPIELAATYVDTFDTRRRGCLYLTYYSSGDTRRRGMALIAIRQAYRAAGLELETDELPDHLVLVLEFSAGTSLEGGLDILIKNRPGIELLRTHLESISSPWHGAIEAVCATLPRMSEAEIASMMSIAAEGPDEEFVGLDGYGTDSVYPASRPGPTFSGSGGTAPSTARGVPVEVTRR